MYCAKCQASARFCSIQLSTCDICDMEFATYNAPPVNLICTECSEKFRVCECCGNEIGGCNG